MEIIGYHTVEDRDNIDVIETQGPFMCTRGDAWLGNGYYFWDTKQHWAHDWGQKCYIRNKREYVVCEGKIQMNEQIFDIFGHVSHQEAFTKIYERLDQLLPPGKKILVRDIITFLQKNNIFPYNGIRSADEPTDLLTVTFGGKRGEQLVINQRVQICLINKNNLILQSFRIVYPEKYVL